ncbi:MAG: hypothetical protein KGK07_16375 [Chloroflexota bacterium]|nr:hypothetical protein [Chloroflexota bacterium]
MTRAAKPDGPRCFACDKRLTRSAARSYVGGIKPEEFKAIWGGYGTMHGGSRYDQPTLFCSLRCAAEFAFVMVRGGHRLAVGTRTLSGGAR